MSAVLGELVAEWRGGPAVHALVEKLTRELGRVDEPFVGEPLPDDLVRGRLPDGIASAWVFVLRPRTRNPAHYHPNSAQHTAAIAGGGTLFLDGEPTALVDGRLYVIPAGAPHAFEPGAEPLAVLSFHTVPPDELVEIEVHGGASRTYR